MSQRNCPFLRVRVRVIGIVRKIKDNFNETEFSRDTKMEGVPEAARATPVRYPRMPPRSEDDYETHVSLKYHAVSQLPKV